MNKQLSEFIDKINASILDAQQSDNCRSKLLYTLTMIQNHEFYTHQDIMTFSGFCVDSGEMLGYVQDKLISIINHYEKRGD